MVRCCLLLVLCGCPRPPAPAAATHAAVAFRDDVPGYQKVATQQYVVHHLKRGYDTVTYVEATAADDGETRFLDAVRAAAAKHTTVDLFFLSHGGRYDRWASALDPATRGHLRFVYNTGAGNAGQGPAWLALGAKGYVGHPAGNVAPLFLSYFLPAWVEGGPLRGCVDEANRQTKGDLTGSVASGVAGVLDAVGGPHLDTPRMWAGTRAELHGDPTLVVK